MLASSFQIPVTFCSGAVTGNQQHRSSLKAARCEVFGSAQPLETRRHKEWHFRETGQRQFHADEWIPGWPVFTVNTGCSADAERRWVTLVPPSQSLLFGCQLITVHNNTQSVGLAASVLSIDVLKVSFSWQTNRTLMQTMSFFYGGNLVPFLLQAKNTLW